jgi:acetyltransferase-like isoleucine patch superfamily enzyme
MTGLNAEYLPAHALAALGFRSLGAKVMVHATAVLVNCSNIALGSNVRIDPYVVVSAGEGGISLGDQVHIAAHCSLVGSATIEMDAFAGLSQGVRIFSASDDYSGATLTNPTVPARFRSMSSAPVSLGRHAIVGANSVLLPGSRLGEGTAVGALSLVNKPLDPWRIYGGVPVRLLGVRSRDLLEAETRYLAEQLHSAGETWGAGVPEISGHGNASA